MNINTERYNRHLILKNFGIDGQQKLANAKVLVIGAGGLGCPVLQYLAAAGVGTIGFVDNDVISLSNLQRQVLYNTEEIGLLKTEVAFQKLTLLNNEINLVPYTIRLNNQSALELIEQYDVIVDCTDNFATRYMINDACVLLNKPLVFAAIYQFEGQLAVFNVEDNLGNKTNYRHLFPTPPNAGEVLDCNAAGVLGVLPGMIGTMQATEAIKLICNIGQPLTNQLLTYNVLNHQSYILKITGNKSTTQLIPTNNFDFLQTNYEWLCNINTPSNVENITHKEFEKHKNQAAILVIDVREINELPKAKFNHIQIPLSVFNQDTLSFKEDTIILFCQSGKRSMQAAEILKEKYAHKKIFNLENGIINLKQ